MKLLLGAIGSTQFVQAISDDADLHKIVAELSVGGEKPDIFSVIPLPLANRNVFVSARVSTNDGEANITMTLGNDSSKPVTISTASEYLNFVGFLKVLIKKQEPWDLLYLYSIQMF